MMKSFSVQNYKVNVCYDIDEWGKEFYGMPEGAEIDNRSELESECMGFAQPEDDEIWIFIPSVFDNADLLTTVAHEVGHVMEWKDSDYDDDKREECRAIHYEGFYLLVNRIIKTISEL